MNDPKNTQSGPKSLQLQPEGFSRFYHSVSVLSAIMLGVTVTQTHAASVPAGSNLTLSLNQATAAEHSFELAGDVVMSSAFNMSIEARRRIILDGSLDGDLRGIISRTGTAYRFNVSMNQSELTIQNAVIRQTTGTLGGGAIYVTANNSNLNFDNTVFTENTAGDALGYGGAISMTSNTNTNISGNVSFINNTSAGQGAGAVGVNGAGSATRSRATFLGETLFEGNTSGYYGGAVVVNYYADITFAEKAIFRNNHATLYYGGALDVYGGESYAVFQKGAEFTNNWVKNTSGQTYGVRGGAINVGFITGSNTPQLELEGTTTFTDNYVWGTGSTQGFGGALTLTSEETYPDIGSPPAGREYEAIIDQGIFKNNIAHSDSETAYGGAIYTKTRNNVLTLGSGSSFTDNYAKTLGGAIYFDQGTLNLNGNVSFEGNRHGALFDTDSNRPVYVNASGTANAIYFAVSSNTATLNLNTGAGEVIHFADPIESAAGKTVTVNKVGSGTALFTGHDSDILAQTLVSQGTFELGEGVAYGRTGTAVTSSFHLDNGATLKGGANSTLRASAIQLDGRLEVESGEFSFDGADVALSSTSVVALTIDDIATYASINMGGNGLAINDAALEITATNYVPSQEISDTFTLVSNLSEQASGMFLQGDSITINGADFAILYNSNNITLQQMTVPEPSTYALILAAGMMTVAWMRRQRKLRTTGV